MPAASSEALSIRCPDPSLATTLADRFWLRVIERPTLIAMILLFVLSTSVVLQLDRGLDLVISSNGTSGRFVFFNLFKINNLDS
jgi:hypothetical protein